MPGSQKCAEMANAEGGRAPIFLAHYTPPPSRGLRFLEDARFKGVLFLFLEVSWVENADQNVNISIFKDAFNNAPHK